jgi:hypothetical protein
LKIALIGTHGVGKTTLAFELAARLKRLDRRVELVTEVARDCPLPINRETTIDAQRWILHTQCAREIAARKADVLLCDRSILDNYAYLVHAAGRQPDFEPWVAGWSKTYAHLVKVPPWRAPTFDGVREVDRTFQLEIDETIDSLVRDLAVEVVPLDPLRHDFWVEDTLRAAGIPLEPTQRELFGEP